jgi:hypothetical protein
MIVLIIIIMMVLVTRFTTQLYYHHIRLPGVNPSRLLLRARLDNAQPTGYHEAIYTRVVVTGEPQ